MNSQWLIVITVVAIFALAGVMGLLYLNSAQMLPATVIDDTQVPLGGVAEGVLVVETQGEGTVIIDPYETAYEPGAEVTLRAMPSQGHAFVRWQGAASGSETTVTLTLQAGKTEVEAVFD